MSSLAHGHIRRYSTRQKLWRPTLADVSHPQELQLIPCCRAAKQIGGCHDDYVKGLVTPNWIAPASDAMTGRAMNRTVVISGQRLDGRPLTRASQRLTNHTQRAAKADAMAHITKRSAAIDHQSVGCIPAAIASSRNHAEISHAIRVP